MSAKGLADHIGGSARVNQEQDQSQKVTFSLGGHAIRSPIPARWVSLQSMTRITPDFYHDHGVPSAEGVLTCGFGLVRAEICALAEGCGP